MRSMLLIHSVATSILIELGLAFQVYGNASDLNIRTSVGTVNGFIDPSLPVKKWLGVPFAEPPVDALRFLPPVAKHGSDVISAFERPASCQQWLTVLPDLYNVQVPQFLPSLQLSEDCLYLNIIAPLFALGNNLPVLVWLHGGAFTYGGINTSYEYPEKWVARSQEHIVVQINYRLNIFGFPNARGLDSNNLGILDQRLALEWIYSNIAAFGGDPEKITFWGQSAGAAMIDAHQFAFSSNPIFRATILESAVIMQANGGSDPNRTSFTFVAQQMGCPINASAAEELECMRYVDAGAIETFLQNHTDSNETPILYFSVDADNKTIFLPGQYFEKGETGIGYANIPMLMGTNAQEGTSFVPFSVNGTGITPALLETKTLEIFQCWFANTTAYRESSNRTTYRYFYSGNFSNISPSSWEGAYHFAEIPLVMGTHNEFRHNSTEFEYALSHKMQDLWLAFAKDPYNGLENEGWNSLNANGTVLSLGKDNILFQKESVTVLDAACSTIQPVSQ
jgi:carboxylesterase type B